MAIGGTIVDTYGNVKKIGKKDLGGYYDSPDFYWDTWDHGGEYEYWVDWTVH